MQQYKSIFIVVNSLLKQKLWLILSNVLIFPNNWKFENSWHLDYWCLEICSRKTNASIHRWHYYIIKELHFLELTSDDLMISGIFTLCDETLSKVFLRISFEIKWKQKNLRNIKLLNFCCFLKILHYFL